MGKKNSCYIFSSPCPCFFFLHNGRLILFCRQIQWNVLRSENCSYSSFHHIFESKKFRFPFSSRIRLTWGVKCEKLKFIRYALKIVPDWKDHLEIFSRPQVIENYRQHLLLRIDYSQKTVIGCPWTLLLQNKGTVLSITGAREVFRFLRGA